MHSPTEDRSYDMNDNFYEELEIVCNQFSKYQMKILLGDFNIELGGELYVLSNQ